MKHCVDVLCERGQKPGRDNVDLAERLAGRELRRGECNHDRE
jgi:hypothetical protein